MATKRAASNEGGVANGGGVAQRAHETAMMASRAGGAGGAGGAGINFTDHGGIIIPNARLVLIFWGAAWGTSPPVTPSTIVNAVQNIVTGPYMNLLHQYRSIGHATIQASITITTAVGTSPASPPNPFSDGDVSSFLTQLFDSGTIVAPATNTQLLYVVFTPNGVGAGGSFIGEHTYFGYHGTNCHYAWVTTGSSLDGITSIFSHELVESVTDPEGTAITGDAGSCNQGGWCEIGDVCYSNIVINGVTVQRYWSQADMACMPTKSWKDTKDFKDVKEGKEHKDIKDIKPEIKEIKEHKPEIKEIKDHKEKEHKELKEPKELKDIHEKLPFEVKHPKEIVETVGFPQGDPYDALRQITELTQRVAELEGIVRQQTGRAFIRPEERPAVGGRALEEADDEPETGGGVAREPKRRR